MKKTAKVGALALIFAAACLDVGVASATPLDSPNLVVNGGFESGLSDWTATGFFAKGYDYGTDDSAHTGQSAFYGGAVGTLGYLSQTLTTTPGVDYAIQLWLSSDGFLPNELQVLWNGVQVFDQVDVLSQGYTEIAIDPIGSGALSTLQIGFRDDSGFLHIDDVSVQAVPEPAAFAMLAAGLLAVGIARWIGAARRRMK